MSSPLFATIELRMRFTSQVPDWISGRALHGLAFRYLRAADSTIAARIHASEIKPFTISLLRPVKGKENEMRWRWTVLEIPLYEAISRQFYLEWRTARERKLTGAPFILADCQMDGGGRTILWCPEDLIKAAEPARLAPIRLISPTAFKMGGNRVTLFPEPAIVWGGLINRLERIAPDLIDDTVFRKRLSELLVSEYHLGTRQLDFPGFVMKGVVGRIAYMAPSTWKRSELKHLAILLQAAQFIGIGAKTTQGMGQCGIWKK